MAQNIHEIKLNDKNFPAILREIPFPPKKLYVWSKNGSFPDLGVGHPSGYRFISIVGTRRNSAYGEEILRKIIAGLKPYGFVTVSGMAIGIDTIAAKASLENEMPTIAVLGSGLSKEAFYPARNFKLAEEIVSRGGAIISEYEPDFKATLWSFPQRNRIISGLSPATLVVEAPESSGALITAKFALDQNRDVLAIPGSPFAPNSRGTNKLIKQGAALVESAEDILMAYGLEFLSGSAALGTSNSSAADLQLSPEEKTILDLLAEPQDIDSLIRKSKMQSSIAQSIMGLLEIRGIIKKLGSEYVRT